MPLTFVALLAASQPLVAAYDRSGPSRRATCRIDDGPARRCIFTPLFGDGGFQIDLPDRALRVVVAGERARVFEVFGPEKRVQVAATFRRDAVRRACWVSGRGDSDPRSICAF